jgi:hypothetical protein
MRMNFAVPPFDVLNEKLKKVKRQVSAETGY